MANNMVQIPRFFYRDTQNVIAEIQNSAEQLGSVKEAMKQRLAPYADRLPAERTIDEIVEQISETTNLFCAAEAEVSNEAVRSRIEEAVAQFTEEEAFCYLSMLEVMFTAMDASADERMHLMSTEEIQADINQKLQAAGQTSLAEYVDKMVDTICESGVKTFVFAGGNDQIMSAVSVQDKAVGAVMVQDVLNEHFSKVDNYAMAACACYEQILQGKIEGMTVENADPRVVAAMVSAGLSKGSILRRLMRGEIDMELAKELLGHVENAIKWVMTVLLQVSVTEVSFLMMVAAVVAFVTTASPLFPVLIGVAAVLAVGLGLSSEEEMEGVSEGLVELAKTVLSVPFKLVRFAYRALTNKQGAQAAAQPQALQPAQA